MKGFLIAGTLATLLLAGGVWWSSSQKGDLLSRNGLHWHPSLEIYIQGEKQEIPGNIGVGSQYAGLPTYDPGMRMTAIHTHDDLPLVHLEFSGAVRDSDVVLGNFFRIWGMPFSSTELMGHTAGEEGQVTMYVNGEQSDEFENYHMRDGDKIELRYE